MSDPIIWNKNESISGISEIGNNCSYTASTSFPTGKFGNMALLDGAYMQDFGSVATGIAFSVSFYWIPTNNTAGTGTALLVSNQYGSNYFCILFQPGGDIEIEVDNSSTAQYHFNMPSWSAGQKIHVGVICDPSAGANNRIKLLIDGTPLSLTSAVVDNSWATTARTFCFGEQQYGGSYSAWGGIDNPKIYDSLVTDSFAWDIANEGLYVAPSGNVCYIIN